jgi:hypothetical protein
MGIITLTKQSPINSPAGSERTGAPEIYDRLITEDAIWEVREWLGEGREDKWTTDSQIRKLISSILKECLSSSDAACR